MRIPSPPTSVSMLYSSSKVGRRWVEREDLVVPRGAVHVDGGGARVEGGHPGRGRLRPKTPDRWIAGLLRRPFSATRIFGLAALAAAAAPAAGAAAATARAAASTVEKPT